jgi:malate/lactate dehydrogenase
MDPGDEPQLISSAFILGTTNPVGQLTAAYKTQTGFFRPRLLGKGEATLDIAVYS